ncbi:MAG: S1/P1 nuclease [Longimicrobiaceae bacterium]
MRRTLMFWSTPVLLLCSAPPAHAWDNVGHEVVARIAWQNLTPAARMRVIQLLNSAAPNIRLRQLRPATGLDRDQIYFVRAATWPDIIKNPGPGHSFDMRDSHFRDRFWETASDGTPRDRNDLQPEGHAVDRIQAFSASVGHTGNASVHARELAWLLHLVGDIHQPLHAESHIPPPGGDRGGNDFSQIFNLHSFWDQLIFRSRGDSLQAGYIDRIAADLMQRFPRASLASELKPGQFAAWADEGYEISKREAYMDGAHPLARNQSPTVAYHARAVRIAERRIALAGYRLADLLNHALS